MNKKAVISYLEERAGDFLRTQRPYLGKRGNRFTEKKSVEDYKAFLEKEGFRVTVGIAGLDTAFRAEFGSGRPVLGFLGEYDAIPDLSQKAGIAEKSPVKA